MLEHIIREAVQRAGRHIREHAFDYGHVEWKAKDDPVTTLDKDAETMIRQEVQARFREPVNIVGEEHGTTDARSPITLYIDPIDGTKSFITREFLSSVSVGVEIDGRLEGGFVYDFMKDILYAGYHRRTYIMSDGAVHDPGSERLLSKLRVVTDKAPLRKLMHLQLSDTTLPEVALAKQQGSFALSMAQVAFNVYDCLIIAPSERANSWDHAGGQYLMLARGMTLTDCHGNTLDHRLPNQGVVAYWKKDETLVKDILLHLQKKSYSPISSE